MQYSAANIINKPYKKRMNKKNSIIYTMMTEHYNIYTIHKLTRYIHITHINMSSYNNNNKKFFNNTSSSSN